MSSSHVHPAGEVSNDLTRPLREWLARQICNYVHIAEESDESAGPGS